MLSSIIRALVLGSIFLSFYDNHYLQAIEFKHLFDTNLYSRDTVTKRYWDPFISALIQHKRVQNGFSIEIHHFNERPQHSHKIELPSNFFISLFEKFTGITSIKPHSLMDFQVYYSMDTILFKFLENYYLYSLSDKNLRQVTYGNEAKMHGELSPNGRFLSYVANNNIYTVDLNNQKVRIHTQSAHFAKLNGHLSWVYQEEIFGRDEYKGYWWSPQGDRIVYLETDESMVEEFPLIDHSNVYPVIRSQKYPKAGRTMPKVKVGLINVLDCSNEYIKFSDLIPNEDYLVVGVSFSPNGKRLVIQTQNRYQNELIFHLLDTSLQGNAQSIYKEYSSTWVNRLQESFHWVNNDSFLFLSEFKTFGHTHIKRISHLNEATVRITQITKGNFDVNAIHYFDEGKLYFSSNAESLLRNQLYFVNPHSELPVLLTQAKYNHEILFFSKGEYFLDKFENINQAPSVNVTHVHENIIKYSHPLFKSEMVNWEKLNLSPAHFVQINNRRGHPMQAMYIAPTVKPLKGIQSPVLSFIYGGPGTKVVTDRFNRNHFLFHQYLASLGYFIWILDPSSSNSRGINEKQRVYQQLGANEALDVLDGINYLMKHFPDLDEQKIGIWGWSYGGFMSAYLLCKYPNLFSFGMSVAPVTDWSLYDSIYTERYMGPKLESIYKKNNIIELGQNMKNPLLLVHGGLDDNVHPQHAQNLLEEMAKGELKAKIDFAYYPLGNHGLGAGYMQNLYDRLISYVKDHSN